MLRSSLPSLILLLITHVVNISSSQFYLQEINRAAYNGDVSKVIELVELQLDWNQLYNDGKSFITAIHHALRGRHDSLSTQSLQLLGNHEVCKR